MKLDSFAAVVQAAGILAGDLQIDSVSIRERLDVFNHNDVFACFELQRREGKINAVREAYLVQVQRLGSDVLQLDEFSVRIVGVTGVMWIEHDLGDPQVLGDRPDGKGYLAQCAPYGAV